MIKISKFSVVLGLALSLSACSSITDSSNDTLTYTGKYETLLFTRCSIETPHVSILPVGDIKCVNDDNKCEMKFKKLAIDVSHCASDKQL
ncbi:hypothetical protein C9J21_20605 [Photobacterium phosphoreum]|uniref:hypothetical protein n=1 Tax=Photobacterium phosphoreum TaxID=659 RepID=UPI000D17B557|nr:hypothetical protein [Photobacterium phosphoreum]PSW28397.1 hypothetical protein C9J21_20605 [Photobacterium phosphoreum]